MLNGKLLSNAFPINKVEVFFDNLDHSDFLGFKWELISEGRVPVGLDINDSDFNTIGKTGGSKYLQEHYHKNVVKYSEGSESGEIYSLTSAWSGTYADRSWIDKRNTVSGTPTGDSGNLQPYIVMAFWKRVA